jgi:multiple sugar transport system permease protein
MDGPVTMVEGRLVAEATPDLSRGSRWRADPGRLLMATALAVGAFFSLMPFVLMVSFSFGKSSEFIQLPPPVIPSALRFDNYVHVFQQVPMLRFVLNSLFVTSLVVVGQLVVCSMAAYAFARLRFRGRTVLFGVFLISLMVPAQLTIVPLFLLMRPLGLIDTPWALIIPSLMNVLGVFLLRQNFAAIPRELEEAAMIDGAGYFRIYWSFILPMCRPALAALAILAFNASWNNFLWPLIVINSTNNMTLPVGITFLNGQQGATSEGVIMAGVVISVIPPLLVFLLLQRRLVDGVTMTVGR